MGYTVSVGILMVDRAREILSDYLANVDEFWGGNDRQSHKAQGRLKLCKSYFGFRNSQLIDFIEKISEERLERNCKTLYMPSFGSSGSHLFQHLISLSYPSITLGEVYIPEKLETLAPKISRPEREKLMEMYHLVSSANPWMISSRGLIINTAHKAALNFYSENTRNFSAILLYRKPSDLVISRTFRKNEYRNYLNKGSISDQAYLDENIKKTINFYKSSLKYNYDGCLDFDDLFSDPDGYSRISDTISLSLRLPDYKYVIEGNIPVALADEKKTNKFQGEPTNIPDWCYEYANNKLGTISSQVKSKFLL
jgi:hypothetical protein